MRHQVYLYAGQLAVRALIYAKRDPDTTWVSHTMCWDRGKQIKKTEKKPPVSSAVLPQLHTQLRNLVMVTSAIMRGF